MCVISVSLNSELPRSSPTMMLGVTLFLVLAITANSANILKEERKRDSISGDDNIESLSNKQMEDLRKIYGLKKITRFGDVEIGKLWQLKELINGTNTPQVTAIIGVWNNGNCGLWTLEQTDRFYHWIGGKTMIDKIHPNGTLVSECLGSTVDDKICKYVVKIPAGWISDVRTTGNFVIMAGVFMHFKTGGEVKSYEYMMTTFGTQHGDMIKETEKCYKEY